MLFTLKKGTTFINFTEKSETSLYYGIRKRSNNGVYLSTLYENYFTIDEATFHFFKANGRQRIVAKGPTKEDLDVLVNNRLICFILSNFYVNTSLKKGVWESQRFRSFVSVWALLTAFSTSWKIRMSYCCVFLRWIRFNVKYIRANRTLLIFPML